MEPSADQIQLDRRLKTAQMLRQQALQQDQQQTAGGYVVPYSPFQGLAKLAQAYLSNKIEDETDVKRKEMDVAKNTKIAEALKNYGKVTDDTSQTRAATPDEQMQQDWQLSQLDPSFAKVVESRHTREDTQAARLEQIRLANELKQAQMQNPAREYYQPIQTADGIYAFNARTGKVEKVESPVGGGAVVGAQYDPALQGRISGAKATGTETGKATGEAITNLADINSMMPRFESLTKELSDLGKKATYTMAGQAVDAGKRQLGMKVGDPAVARKEYISKVDNEVLPLLRQTFGAAFTVEEGKSLRATLGDADASPEEKDAMLRTFIQTKKQQVESLQRRTGGVNQQPQAPSGGAKFLGFE